MKRQNRILIGLLAVFIVGMTLGIAFAEPVDAKSFRSSNGYTWEIKNSTWDAMKKNAKEKYNHMREIVSSTPGYSNSVNVTVEKNGIKYEGIAMAVQNDNRLRCEVRGALPNGEYLTDDSKT